MFHVKMHLIPDKTPGVLTNTRHLLRVSGGKAMGKVDKINSGRSTDGSQTGPGTCLWIRD